MNVATLIAFAGVATAASGFDVGTFFGSMTLQDIGQTVGLGALAYLFASDRILTKGQHERRVTDIVAAHEALLAERSLRYEEVKASRDYYRGAVKVEKERADEVTQQLRELAVEAATTVSTTMNALETAAREVGEHGG